MLPTGGYLIHKLDFILGGGHTAELSNPVSPASLAAVNAIQNTPWRINTWILDVMGKAWADGIRIAGLEVGEPLSIPDRLEDADWAALTKEQKTEHTLIRRRLHEANVSIMGKSQAVLDNLGVATECRHLPEIWFPHVVDFRHRVYPAVTSGPNPQGDDIAKSLLMFAVGKPLGPTGLWWLSVRAANCFGYDKVSLEDRVIWTQEHLTHIQDAALNPLGSTWWTTATEPWALLATCHELTMAHSLSTGPETFVSHLPVPLDGSCNGLQHLAAMGLDMVGATATNLTANPQRQDIYQTVADRVSDLIAKDLIQGVSAATAWPAGSIGRNIVKRAVMTTPYGVTDRGIRDQLIGDGFVTEAAAAEYLKDKIVEALGGTVSSARDIMGWLQEAARRLAEAGLPFDWTVPSGSQVRQAYRPETLIKVSTLLGEVAMAKTNPEGGVVTRKQVTGAAPNFIHSFDAAHLTLTVNAAVEAGIENFAMIHDSYGTHACDTTELGVILRREFVNIYRTDWLERLAEEIHAYAPHVTLSEPPRRGTFNIAEVHESEYFFS